MPNRPKTEVLRVNADDATVDLIITGLPTEILEKAHMICDMMLRDSGAWHFMKLNFTGMAWEEGEEGDVQAVPNLHKWKLEARALLDSVVLTSGPDIPE